MDNHQSYIRGKMSPILFEDIVRERNRHRRRVFVLGLIQDCVLIAFSLVVAIVFIAALFSFRVMLPH